MTSLVAAVSRFFTWWLSEITGLLPAGWRSAFGNRRQRLLINLSGDEASFQYGRGSARRDLGSIPLGARKGEGPNEHGLKLLKPYLARVGEVVLVLPRSGTLRRQVELPLATSENLREVLGFEMDRHTPFKTDEVYFDYRLVKKDVASKQLTVDLVVATRAFVDEVMERLSDWGIQPDRLGIQGSQSDSAEKFNLLPASSHGRAESGGSRVTAVAALAACILLAVVVYLPIQQKQARLAQVQSRLAVVQAEAAQASQLSTQVDQLIERGQYVVRQKQQEPAVAELFAEVTNLLPDDTWIIQLSWTGDRLTLAGYSGSSSSLIALLEKSRLLSNVRFNSPVTVDRKFNLERFNLSATVNAKEVS